MPAEIILQFKGDYDKAHRWLDALSKDPSMVGARVTYHKPRRTLPQNARMWAMLTDIAQQAKIRKLRGGRWITVRQSTDDWKLFFLGLLGVEREAMRDPYDPDAKTISIDRIHSSSLSKSEMSDMIELLFAFGARARVQWSDPNEDGSRNPRRIP